MNVEAPDILLETLYTAQTIHVGSFPCSPVDTVRNIVRDSQEQNYPVFAELMELNYNDNDEECWFEKARWIKYEETVEGSRKRWSKPHITVLTARNLLQVRNCLQRGATILDLDNVDGFEDLLDRVIAAWLGNGQISEDEIETLVTALLQFPKIHITGKSKDLSLGDSATELNKIGRSESRRGSTVDKPLGDEISDESPRGPSESEQEKSQTSEISSFLPLPLPLSKIITKGSVSGIRRKMPPDSEAANIFVGQLSGINPLAAFVRLKEGNVFPEMPEVRIPTRFVVILLTPKRHIEDDLLNIGRCFGTLLVDEIFQVVAYNATDSSQLCCCVEEFLSQSLIIPPGKWSRELRLEPSANVEVAKHLREMEKTQKYTNATQSVPHALTTVGLVRTGRFFGGLISDVKRKFPHYLSDFKDFFQPSSLAQCLATTMFLFFAGFTKIVSFGGMMEQVLGKQMATMENILAGGMAGLIYSLFAGQPLSVLSATGPVLVFEVAIYKFCEAQLWDFLVVRFWIGLWTAVILVILVASDASFLANLITRFTEDTYSTLVSVIFITSSITEIAHMATHHPITTNPTETLNRTCGCQHNSYANNNSSYLSGNMSESNLHAECTFEPDVFLFSVILFFTTFFIAYNLKLLKQSRYFPTKIRNTISEFGVVIAVVTMTAISLLVGIKTPGLDVPTSIIPTVNRSWIINPFKLAQFWIPLISVIPAAFLSILVVMNQHITAMILNRRENKLKKGYGYHLDLFVLAIIFILSGLLGLPFYVAGTVVAIMHIESLKLMSDSTAPGEKPKFLGVREQRMTNIVASTLCALSVFLTPVIRLISLPVLLGIILYMGVASLSGQQFIQRLTILLMPVKYQPDYKFLRLIPLTRVHLFTLIQLICFTIILAIQYVRSIAMLFPLMLLLLILVRKFLLAKLFTVEELSILDTPLISCAELLNPNKLARQLSRGEGVPVKGLPRLSIRPTSLEYGRRSVIHEHHERHRNRHNSRKLDVA